MTHPIVERLQQWHEGQLAESDAALVRAHCATCETCRATLNALARVESLLAAPMEAGVPLAFAERVMWQVRQEPRLARSWQLPSESIAPLVVGVVGVALLAMPLRGAEIQLEGLTGAQWYAIIAGMLLGIVPLWTGWRAVARD